MALQKIAEDSAPAVFPTCGIGAEESFQRDFGICGDPNTIRVQTDNR